MWVSPDVRDSRGSAKGVRGRCAGEGEAPRRPLTRGLLGRSVGGGDGGLEAVLLVTRRELSAMHQY